MAFAATYGAVLCGRALWPGQPPAVPLHQLSSGALLLFTFFMISDPKTTPDSRAGRLLFGILVALGAGLVQFVLFRPNSAQELFLYALNRQGRVETTNYRTVKLPSDIEVPDFVKDDFARFYRSLLRRQVDRQAGSAVFLEYAWDMACCDPCAADPLTHDELRALGVFCTGSEGASGGQDVFVSRLHLLYDSAHFPEDLTFQQTGDRGNFQGRYVLRHPWKGGDRCEAATAYHCGRPRRAEGQARSLAALTGWDVKKLRGRMNLPAGQGAPAQNGWAKTLWPD